MQTLETELVKVGVREFRDNLSTYLVGATTPVAITRHGDTIGFYIPLPQKRSSEQAAAFHQAHAKLQESMAAAGVTEDDLVEDFKRLRRADRRR